MRTSIRELTIEEASSVAGGEYIPRAAPGTSPGYGTVTLGEIYPPGVIATSLQNVTTTGLLKSGIAANPDQLGAKG